MPELTCSICGQMLQDGECPKCRAATAITDDSPLALPAANPVREDLPLPSIRKEAQHIVRRWLPHLFVAAAVATAICLLIPPVAKGPSNLSTTMNLMRQIGLAFHNHASVNKGHLPTPTMIVAKDGKDQQVQLSWRVSLLPFLEQDKMFKEMDKTAGWDDPKNTEFQGKMPFEYSCPYREQTDPTQLTHFQCLTGPGTLFPNNTPPLIGALPDGTSRTLLFAEADQAVIWTKPADMAIRADQPLPLPEQTFLAGMVDGRVIVIDRSRIDDAILRQLIHPNDGKPGDGWER